MDIELSAPGTVLMQQVSTSPMLFASAPTGGSPIFSVSAGAGGPARVSPDGTLVAYSSSGSPQGGAIASTGTNLLLNGSLVTAFNGLTVGWLDNTRLVVNNYVLTGELPRVVYSGCALYGPTGAPTNASCAIPVELSRFQPVTGQSDLIYSPQFNQVLSVSTGASNWASGNSHVGTVGALAGSNVIFVSDIDLVAQSY